MLHTDEQRFVNYCDYPYTPRASPEGKLRSRDLLEAALAELPWGEAALGVMRTLRARLGADRTIWALKKKGPRLGLELYFYNYGRHDPLLRPEVVREALAPHLRSADGLARCDRMRYFLFSLDLNADVLARGELAGLHVYLHGVADRQTGISYWVDAAGATLENHYAFYRPKLEPEALEIKVRDTPFVDFTRTPLSAVLIPELLDCATVCSANKPTSDCVYFSGIGVDQLRYFLRKYDYSPSLCAWVDGHRDRLDHLEYDVGIDYRAVDGALDTSKTGFGGTY